VVRKRISDALPRTPEASNKRGHGNGKPNLKEATFEVTVLERHPYSIYHKELGLKTSTSDFLKALVDLISKIEGGWSFNVEENKAILIEGPSLKFKVDFVAFEDDEGVVYARMQKEEGDGLEASKWIRKVRRGLQIKEVCD